MKIKNISQFVVGAMLFSGIATAVGCAGGGTVTHQTTGFQAGMYVSTYDGMAVKYFSNFNGANPQSEVTDSDAYCQAIDKQGRLYIGTKNNQIIMVPTPGSPNRIVFGAHGSGTNQFNHPNKIAFDSVGRIYVADLENRRIVRFDDMTGANWTVLDLTPYVIGPIDGPSSLAFDPQDTIYLTMQGSDQLMRFGSMTDTTPVSFGSPGTGLHQFLQLSDVHITPQYKILLTDRYNNRIVQMENIGGDGWQTYGNQGIGIGQFNQPLCITSDSQGRIYVTDSENGRVCRMNDISGAGWATFGSLGTGANQFPNVGDITIRE